MQLKLACLARINSPPVSLLPLREKLISTYSSSTGGVFRNLYAVPRTRSIRTTGNFLIKKKSQTESQTVKLGELY